MKCRCYSEKYLRCICGRSQDTQNLTEHTGSRGFTHMGCVSHSGSHQHCSWFLTSGVCRCPLRTDVWSALQIESMFWQMWGELPHCSAQTSSSVLTPLPLMGNPHVKEEAGNRPDSAVNHPSRACLWVFVPHPASMGQGQQWVGVPIILIRWQRPESCVLSVTQYTFVEQSGSWCDSAWVNICLWWPAGPNLVRRVASKHWWGVDKL